MYDPSAVATGTAYSASSSSSTPPRWSGHNTQYYPGAIVWHLGTLWRCEQGHLSSDRGGQPERSLHLWTPMSSTISYGQPPPSPTNQGFDRFLQANQKLRMEGGYSNINRPGTGPTSSQPKVIAPQPEIIGFNHQSSSSEQDECDSSPDSNATITPGEPSSSSRDGHKSYQGIGMSTAQFFSSKADESMRFLITQQESGKAKSEDEWKDELKGKRIWRVGGLGMWAYDQDDQVEAAKESMWRKWGDKGKGEKEWLEAARERTAFYTQARGIKPLVTWKLVQAGTSFTFPPDALQIGHEGHNGQPLFSARAWHQGGLHLGKAGQHLNRGCTISYGGGEVTLDTFEVLCGKPEPTLLKWICFGHGEKVRVEGWQPVEGGREKDGQSLFIAKGEWEGGEHPGKCRITDDHAHVGWGGGEVWIRPFYVLAYNNSTRR